MDSNVSTSSFQLSDQSRSCNTSGKIKIFTAQTRLQSQMDSGIVDISFDDEYPISIKVEPELDSRKVSKSVNLSATQSSWLFRPPTNLTSQSTQNTQVHKSPSATTQIAFLADLQTKNASTQHTSHSQIPLFTGPVMTNKSLAMPCESSDAIIGSATVNRQLNELQDLNSSVAPSVTKPTTRKKVPKFPKVPKSPSNKGKVGRPPGSKNKPKDSSTGVESSLNDITNKSANTVCEETRNLDNNHLSIQPVSVAPNNQQKETLDKNLI